MPKTSRPYSLKKSKYGTWYYTLLPGSGLPPEFLEKRRTTGHQRRDRAEQFVLRRIAELTERAKLARDRPGAITLGEFAEPFYTERCPHLARIGTEVSPGTVQGYRSVVEAHILSDPIAELYLDCITPNNVAEFRSRLLAKPARRKDSKLSRDTVRGYMERLRTILNEAVVQGLITQSPAQAVPRLSVRSHRGRFTRDELVGLFAERPGVWPSDAAWMGGIVAAMTGMRQSEISGLLWDRVHDGWIRVDRAWKDRTTLGRTKTDETRDIPIAQTLQRLLERWAEKHDQSGLVFRSPKGNADTLYRYGDNWPGGQAAKALKKAELVREDETGRRSLHSMRHTLASILIEDGVSPVLVQKYFGWSDRGRNTALTPVQGGYTHLSRSALQPVADAIEEIFSPLVLEDL